MTNDLKVAKEEMARALLRMNKSSTEIRTEMESAKEARQMMLPFPEVHPEPIRVFNVRWSEADSRLVTRICMEYRMSNNMNELVRLFNQRAEVVRTIRAISDQARNNGYVLLEEMYLGARSVCPSNTEKLNALAYVASKLREKDPL